MHLYCVVYILNWVLQFEINVSENRRGNQKWTIQRNWKINVREYRRGNQKWTIQRNWQHRVQNTHDKDKQRTHNTEN